MGGAPSNPNGEGTRLGRVLLEISQQTYGAEPWPVTYPINRPCMRERSPMILRRLSRPALLGRVSTRQFGAWQEYHNER